MHLVQIVAHCRKEREREPSLQIERERERESGQRKQSAVGVGRGGRRKEKDLKCFTTPTVTDQKMPPRPHSQVTRPATSLSEWSHRFHVLPPPPIPRTHHIPFQKKYSVYRPRDDGTELTMAVFLVY